VSVPDPIATSAPNGALASWSTATNQFVLTTNSGPVTPSEVTFTGNNQLLGTNNGGSHIGGYMLGLSFNSSNNEVYEISGDTS
jgi:hypothetical protein